MKDAKAVGKRGGTDIIGESIRPYEISDKLRSLWLRKSMGERWHPGSAWIRNDLRDATQLEIGFIVSAFLKDNRR